MDLICGLAAIFLSGLIYVKKLWFFLFVCGVVWWRDACSSLLTPPPIGEWSIVMSVSVCVCVCLCPPSYLRNYTSELTTFFVHVTYGRGSILLRRRSDTLRIAGFA